MRIACCLTVGTLLLTSAGIAPIHAQSYGFAAYSALITASGATSRSSGVASSQRLGAGNYLVTFSRPVDTCIFTATAVSTSAIRATAFNKNGNPTTIGVRTFASSGAAADSSFNIIVSCAS